MRCSDRARTVGGCCAQAKTIDQVAERLSSPGTRDRASGRRRLRALGLASLLSATAALCISPAAFALSQQGHSFEFSFAKKGSAEGQLSSPSGVAVNEKTGDVYVVDSANNRVEVFSHKGEFIEVWGWGVKDGKSEFEICKQGEGVCQPGIAGTGEGQFDAPEAIAVDNSTSAGDESAGDVYVVSETENSTVEKFGPNGESLGRLPTGAGSVGGVAVDANGGVWAYFDEEAPEVEGFNNASKNAFVGGVTLEGKEDLGVEALCGRPGFAVDAAAHAFYADHERPLYGECLEQGIASSAKEPAITAKLERVLGDEGEARSVSEGLDAENSSAVAVDESSGKQTSGDVYVDNRTSIAAFDASGSLIQRFGEGELSKGAGVAVDAATGEVYVADAAKDRVDVFALNPESSAPEINSVSAQNESPTTAKLTAEIDPHGAKTEYRFEYATVKCPSSCTVSSGTIEAGFGDQEVHVQAEGLQPGTTYFYRVVAKNAKGEAPPEEQELHTFTTLPNPAGVLADGRSWEMVSPAEKHGASPEPVGWGVQAPLGGIIESSEEGNAITYAANSPFEAQPEANRAPEGVQMISNRTPQGWSTHEIITPNEHGTGLATEAQEYRSFTPDLSLALVEPLKANPKFPQFQEPPLAPQEPGVKEQRGLYRRHNPTCLASPATCYEPLITTDDKTPEPFGGTLTYVSASSDLNHVIFRSEARLTENAPSEEGGLYEWNAGEPARLEYISRLPTSKSGRAKALPEAMLGDDSELSKSESDRNAISANGSRVFFSNEAGEAGSAHQHLYMRDTEKNVTLEVNAPQEGVPHGNREQEELVNKAEFQTASNTGSRVFFTDTVSLTAESRLRPMGEHDPADLYVCEVAERGEGDACNLKDLTVDKHSNLGESAEVIGTMLGASEDGSTIYFVANGVLAPGAVHGTCARPTNELTAPPGARCNLYKEQYSKSKGEWQEPRLVAVLSAEDEPDWARSFENPELFRQTARVSSDGEYLAFMSDQPLTGYDNQDANSGLPDEEVFLYERDQERIVCVSCNPNPEVRPTGVFDTINAGEGETGLLVDPLSSVWPDRWLAGSILGWTPTSNQTNPYQSRYLLDNGRLFFNSADALVGHDVEHRVENAEGHQYQVGVENVYEYEPQGVGSCQLAGGCVSLISAGGSEHESAFLDASSSGSNAFFLTSQQLLSSDHDLNFDVYDARECGEAGCLPQPPPPPGPCSGESCRSVSPPSAPVYQPGATSTFSGPGNAGTHVVEGEQKKKTKTLTRKQKLARAVALCRKRYKHSRRKRVVCERRANRAYGAKRASTHTKASAHKRSGKR